MLVEISNSESSTHAMQRFSLGMGHSCDRDGSARRPYPRYGNREACIKEKRKQKLMEDLNSGDSSRGAISGGLR